MEQINALFSRIAEIQPRNRVAIGLGICGTILFIGGLIWSLSSFSQALPAGKQPQNIEFIPAQSTAQATNSKSKIVIDVEGSVQKPGVYTLPADARMQDALIAAGGLSAGADREWVSKSLNLAAKLGDGMKVYIPSEGEIAQGQTVYGLQSIKAAVDGSQLSISGLININSASVSELDKLSGVGVVTAQKIIDNRPYSSIDELKSKKIVGAKVFEQIKDKIVAQ